MVEELQLWYYQTPNGRAPFRGWVESLSDPTARAALRNRLARLQRGLLGDCKPVGEGVFELRIDVGPGYRAYIARVGERIVLLLCGGGKRAQSRDIRRAKDYWSDYEKRTRAGSGAG
jgi:putative addiction module killer protein